MFDGTGVNLGKGRSEVRVLRVQRRRKEKREGGGGTGDLFRSFAIVLVVWNTIHDLHIFVLRILCLSPVYVWWE